MDEKKLREQVGKPLGQAKYALFGGIILIISAPFILTRSTGLVSFLGTGQIGDTIGGITAPIIGLVGAILVYFALKAQVTANLIIQRQVDDEKKTTRKIQLIAYFNDAYKMLNEELNGFKFKSLIDTRREGTGVAGIRIYLQELQNYYSGDLHAEQSDVSIYTTELEHILLLLEILIQKLNDPDLSKEEKQNSMLLFRYLYESKLSIIGQFTDKISRCLYPCSRDHGTLPPHLFAVFMRVRELIANTPI
jgi:hypothetical protein